MNNLRYDEEKLVEDLKGLPRRLRVVFAAACAERLLTAYGDFVVRAGREEPRELNLILEGLWADLERDVMTPFKIEEQIRVCMEAISCEDDEPWMEEKAVAEDAGAALAYALRCRKTGESQEAAWAARRAYEALDHFVISRENIDPNRPGAEQDILAHPLIQAELARQQRDLDELLGVSSSDAPSVVVRIHERARTEAKDFFESDAQR